VQSFAICACYIALLSCINIMLCSTHDVLHAHAALYSLLLSLAAAVAAADCQHIPSYASRSRSCHCTRNIKASSSYSLTTLKRHRQCHRVSTAGCPAENGSWLAEPKRQLSTQPPHCCWQNKCFKTQPHPCSTLSNMIMSHVVLNTHATFNMHATAANQQ
jgi:hypothetical protein